MSSRLNWMDLPAAMREHKHAKWFWQYHEANPATYAFFVDMARRAMQKGYTRCSIKHLIECGRWEQGKDFSIGAGFSHNFQSLYARLIMLQEPDLGEAFEIRTLIASPLEEEAFA